MGCDGRSRGSNILNGNGADLVGLGLRRAVKAVNSGGREEALNGTRGVIHGAQAGKQGFLGGKQFIFRDAAILTQLKLVQDFLPHRLLLLEINAGIDGDNTLAAIVAGTDGIAQGLLFPDLHKQLAGLTAAEHGVAHLHGGETGIVLGDGGQEAHGKLALGNIHGFTLGEYSFPRYKTVTLAPAFTNSKAASTLEFFPPITVTSQLK